MTIQNSTISTSPSTRRLGWPRLLWVTALLAAMASIAACDSGDTGAAAIQGVVMELGTNKPLVGSIVVAEWRGVGWTGLGGGGHGTSCLHVETAVTDAAGKFVIPAWRFSDEQLKDFTFRFDKWTGNAYPYYPGYRMVDGPAGSRTSVDGKGVGTYLMEPDTVTAEQRLNRLKGYDSSCGGSAESRRALRPLYAAMWAEGQPLLPTVERRFDVEAWARQAQE